VLSHMQVSFYVFTKSAKVSRVSIVRLMVRVRDSVSNKVVM